MNGAGAPDALSERVYKPQPPLVDAADGRVLFGYHRTMNGAGADGRAAATRLKPQPRL